MIAMPSPTARADESEDSLVRRAQRGERMALGELFRRHERRVYSLVRRMVRREAEAVELTQETFLRAISSCARLDPARPFRPWLFGIAINVCRNHRRRGARRELPDEMAAPEASVWQQPTADPEVAAGHREAVTHVLHHLQTLPPDTRALLLLRVREDLSYAELRRVFGLPEFVLKMRVHRAVAQLRRLVTEPER